MIFPREILRTIGGCNGIKIASSCDQPRFKRLPITPCLMPVMLAHSDSDLRSPRATSQRVVRLFRLCSAWLAQRQLLGSYGPSLSIRSSECPGGATPISAKKFSNEWRQRSQTNIPRAPYHFQWLFVLVWHRIFMPAQMSCVRDLVIPCLSRIFRVVVARKHPHDLVCPPVRRAVFSVDVFPQSHLQSQFEPSRLIAVNIPKRIPSKAFRADMRLEIPRGAA